jgi:hypothetical protein
LKYYKSFNKMLVTDSTLVGYTILTGTFRLQLALLVGALFNVI